MDTNTEHSEENTDKSKRKLDKHILDNFTNLVKPNEGIRIKSSVNLLRYLSEHDEKVNELDYALGRIIRGLGSSTSSARTGFYTVLVATLNFNESVNVDKIFNIIEKQLHKAGSNTKSENGDIATGQILACGAIIRSRLWTTASLEEKQNVFSIIINASKERVYLGLLANNFIINSLENLSEKKFLKLFPSIKEEISKSWDEQTIDSLYLLDAVKNKYPNIVSESFFLENLGMNNLICDESLEKLCNILLTIPRLASLKHPFYTIISKQIASHELLSDFTKHLDAQLTTRNRNKLLAAFKIYIDILQFVVKTSYVPHILSKNFIQHTLNYFKNVKDDEEFQKSVNKFFEALLTTLKREEVKSKTKISVLKKLLFYPGTFIFEKVTKSKIIQQITANLDEDGVKNLATLYRGVVAGTERIDSQDEHWLNNDRLYAAHLLVKMLNLPAVKEDKIWKVEQLCFLIDLGLFKNESDGNVGSELAGSLRTTFFGALDLKLTKLDDLVDILLKLFNHLNSKINIDNLQTVLRNPISDETYEIWMKTAQKIAKIEKKRKRNDILKIVFLTLFLQMGLQLFNEAKLATDSLQELFACYEKSRKSRKDSVNSQDESGASGDHISQDQTDNDPVWIEVVVDLFLNLLSHNSHLLRHLVNCVFPHLCQYMTPIAIHQILSVLDPEKDSPLSKNDSDTSDSDSENENSNEEPPDEVNEIMEESESEDEYNDDENEKETVNEKLRMALHEVLSKNDGYQTDESVDLDDISETEGKELDKALAAAFREYRPNRGKQKKQSKDEETLAHFRIRVLDLIEIYLNSTPSMQLSLEIMLPLLQAVEFSIRDDHQKPLHNRLKSCLKHLTNLKKFSDTDGVHETLLCNILKSLLDKGTKTTWIVQDMRLEIAQCCTFIIRCSDIVSSVESTVKMSKKQLKNSLTEIISTELDSYFHKRDSLTPIVLFKNILGLSWDGCLVLVPSLLRYIFEDDVKPFKKNQATELLRVFYQNQRFLGANLETVLKCLKTHHEQFSENIVTFFVALCDKPEDKNIKEKFVCSLFSLLTVIKTCCLKVGNIDWTKIAEVIRKYRSQVTFSKDARRSFNKLCNRLGVSNIVEIKHKTTKPNGLSEFKEAEQIETINNQKKIKKTKNKEKLKLKKEAKEMRLQSLSEGLTTVNFTEVDTVNVENEESEDTLNQITLERHNSDEISNETNHNKSKKEYQKKRKFRTADHIIESDVSRSKKNKLQH